MRAVLDTNVVVSGLIWHGAPSVLLKAAAAGEMQLFTSPVLLDELTVVLTRPHLRARIEQRVGSLSTAIDGYSRLSTVVVPSRVLRQVPGDSDDDHVVAAAVAAAAELIVSGDKHLLRLGTVAGIGVLTPATALDVLRLPSPG